MNPVTWSQRQCCPFNYVYREAQVQHRLYRQTEDDARYIMLLY